MAIGFAIPMCYVSFILPTRIPPGRAVAVTVVVVLWLHGSIVFSRFLVITTLIAHISFRMSLVEVAPIGVVGIDIESPSSVLPCQGAVEVRETDVLVVLVSSQDILEVSIPTAPPSTVHVIATVHTQEVVASYCAAVRFSS